jgi:hypothetical protein
VRARVLERTPGAPDTLLASPILPPRRQRGTLDRTIAPDDQVLTQQLECVRLLLVEVLHGSDGVPLLGPLEGLAVRVRGGRAHGGERRHIKLERAARHLRERRRRDAGCGCTAAAEAREPEAERGHGEQSGQHRARFARDTVPWLRSEVPRNLTLLVTTTVVQSLV